MDMYKGKFASELSINDVKEYYDELRENCPLTKEQWADFVILQERLIVFACKILGGKTNGDVIKLMFPNVEWLSNHKGVDYYCLGSDSPYAPKLSTFKGWLDAPYKSTGRYENDRRGI